MQVAIGRKANEISVSHEKEYSNTSQIIIHQFQSETSGFRKHLFINDFYFFHYSWFTMFCRFSTVQQGDPVTHTHVHSFFSHHHAPS